MGEQFNTADSDAGYKINLARRCVEQNNLLLSVVIKFTKFIYLGKYWHL